MVPFVFSMLGLAACTFLMYVLVQFRRELLYVKRDFAGEPKLTEVDVRRIEAALISDGKPSHAGEGQQTKTEAVMRREMLISGILGLFGLLAPFILVMLLTSSGRWHH